MRPSVASDRTPVERFIAARYKWMADQGVTPWPQSASEMADKVLRAPVWVVDDGAGTPVAMTILLDQTGTAIFTEQERQQTCLFLTSTITDPEWVGKGLGTQIAHWMVNRAHSEGKQWGRRVTTEARLAEYYTEQGFSLIRTREHNGNTLRALQRKAEPLEVLPTRE